jgi:3-dehydroquinate synthetase
MFEAMVEHALSDSAAPNRVLSLTASRTIAYTVEHTPAPVFDVANGALAAAAGGLPVLIVVDDLLWPEYGAQIECYAQAKLNCAGIVRRLGSEATKSLDEVSVLCGAALEVNLPRHGAFIAVGGGTILDAVGFAASIYRRGVAYIRVPTTLIGMIDVGVGIKQAVNFHNKKNALGSFYAPRCTINDPRFLWKLPRRELACGLAEALKMGLICDAALFELLENHGGALIDSGFRFPEPAATDVLMRAEVAMMAQLESNLYELELRRLVDFGHTFSPVIETASNYAVAHGEAVALDMLLSTAIAVGRRICNPELIVRLKRLYARTGLPVKHALMSPLLMERALVDARAHRGGALNLVVPTTVGSAEFLQDVSYDEMDAAVRAIAVS